MRHHGEYKGSFYLPSNLLVKYKFMEKTRDTQTAENCVKKIKDANLHISELRKKCQKI